MPDPNDPTFSSPGPSDAPTRDPAGADEAGPHTTDVGPSTSVGPGGRVTRVPDIPGYELHEEIGRGGMGVVYKARQVKLDRVVAVKVLLRADPGGVAARRFDTEARAVARMQHPNIVQVFEVGEADGRPFLALEFVPDGTLTRKVADALLPPRSAAALLATLAAAVQYAHDHGVVHRDLKPGNILLSADGTPKIADFGLARPTETDSDLTTEGTILGTPSYMPPEQASGEHGRVGPPADVYALGAILYDLLTGRPPFKGSSVMDTLQQVRTTDPTPPANLQPGVPRDLETICLKCLEKEPAKRYATAAALADDLNRYLRGEPILARPVGPAGRAWRWCRRNPRVAGLLGAVATLLLLIAGGSAAAAVAIDSSRRQIVAQRDQIAAQRDDLSERERVVAAQKKLAEDRLELYRSAVDAFVNEAPAVLDSHPLAADPARELMKLSLQILENANKQTDDRRQSDRGKLAVAIRRGLIAESERRVDEADGHYAEAEVLARDLYKPGNPERDKAAGNLALVLNLRGGVARTRASAAAADGPLARKLLADAIRLHEEALALQLRVLGLPESGEIPAAEARTWIADTHHRLALARRQSAAVAPDPATARAQLVTGLSNAAAGLAENRTALASGALAPRLRDRTAQKLLTYDLDYARLAAQLETVAAGETGLTALAERFRLLVEADAAFARALAAGEALVKAAPGNLAYRKLLVVAAAEYGDFLLMRRDDAAGAKRPYTLSVVHLRPIAEPAEMYPELGTLALNYYRLATANLATGDRAGARRVYGLAADVRENQLRQAAKVADPKNPAALVSPRINLMLAQARAGRYAEAAAFAAELAAGFPDRANWQWQAAAGFGLGADAVPFYNPWLRADYLDRAFACLSRAVGKGYADRTAMERDPDLDPLRADPRFPPLLDAVKAANKP